MRSAAAPGVSPGLRGRDAPDGLLQLGGGKFRMGAVGAVAYPADGEGPIHVVELSPHRMSATAVTNEEFAAFVEATGHRTEAERYGWSFVFGGLLPDDFPDTRAVAQAPWWRQVEGAHWRHPEGPHSDLDGRGDHPVVHVSWADAVAYCAWRGGRLPTEAEWEHAARGGLQGKTFPWGDELEPGGHHAMNVFQGAFPGANSIADGYAGTAPVDAFEPNGFGAFNMTGNVWEWCADWFSPTYYRHSPRRDPQGPPSGTHRVMRGGSYLCHASYCRRYRVAARSANTPDSSTGNLGFRLAADA
jgi:formylglycine-generating enzyme required for sulfatase activity